MRENVQRIAGSDCANRGIAVDWFDLFPGAASVTTEAVLILVDGRIDQADAVNSTDAGDISLGDADGGWSRKRPDLR